MPHASEVGLVCISWGRFVWSDGTAKAVPCNNGTARDSC